MVSRKVCMATPLLEIRELEICPSEIQLAEKSRGALDSGSPVSPDTLKFIILRC